MDFKIMTVGHRVEQRVSLTIGITGAQPIPWSYTRSGKTWRPFEVSVTFERFRRDVQPWQPWRALGGTVRGHNVLSSGENGASRSERLDSMDDPEIRAHVASITARLIEYGPEVFGATPEPEPVEPPLRGGSTVVTLVEDGSTVVTVVED